ncbi:MAG TPA: A24 family peptidase [Nocardioides sp.]|uniref:A24 family peptidase n=1 Tax=Nocardioides sp. TaxID=35761 RepID=UPI002F3FB38D
MSVALVVVCAAAAAVASAAVPAVVRRLPEPPPPDAPEQDAPADAATAAVDPPRRKPRRPVPDFSLWGMHAREREKEPYIDLAAVPHLAWGCAIAGAVLGALVGWRIGWHAALAITLPVVPVGVAIAVVDWRTRLIPSRLVLPATAYVVACGLVIWPITGDRTDLVRAVVSLVVVRSLFWIFWFIHTIGMGFGDVRLSALIGFLLGYLSPGALVFGIWIGFVAFSLPGVVLALVKRNYQLLRVPFPFGPFMLLGAVIGVLAGQPAMAGLTG